VLARQKEVLVEQLNPVTGEIERCEIRTKRLPDEALGRAVEREGVAVEDLRHVETEIAQTVGDRCRIALRIRQGRGLLELRIADDQRDEPVRPRLHERDRPERNRNQDRQRGATSSWALRSRAGR